MDVKITVTLRETPRNEGLRTLLDIAGEVHDLPVEAQCEAVQDWLEAELVRRIESSPGLTQEMADALVADLCARVSAVFPFTPKVWVTL